jgi:hypothetical protein
MDLSAEFVALVRDARVRCLWFYTSDYLPSERALQLRVLALIKRYGTREDYVRARNLEAWLRQSSSAAFSVC